MGLFLQILGPVLRLVVADQEEESETQEVLNLLETHGLEVQNFKQALHTRTAN